MTNPSSIEQAKPWEAEGVSRRTWYRRKASEKAAAQPAASAASAAPSMLSAIDIRAAEASAPPTPVEIETRFRDGSIQSIDNLTRLMLRADSELARVKAATLILDRGYGRPSADTGVDMLLPLFDEVFLETAHGLATKYARGKAPLAIETIERIATYGASAAARIAANKAFLERGLGTVTQARLEAYRANSKIVGKKEEAAQAAILAGIGTEWGDDLTPPNHVN